jgi:acetolactate synthase regulatory subunit
MKIKDKGIPQIDIPIDIPSETLEEIICFFKRWGFRHIQMTGEAKDASTSIFMQLYELIVKISKNESTALQNVGAGSFSLNLKVNNIDKLFEIMQSRKFVFSDVGMKSQFSDNNEMKFFTILGPGEIKIKFYEILFSIEKLRKFYRGNVHDRSRSPKRMKRK